MGIFAAGVLFGTAGIKILSSKDAKKVYTHGTAAALRAKDFCMKTAAADVGIAISDGAEIAREIAAITISSDDLYQVVTLRLLSASLMRRIRKNYRAIVGINTALILLGVGGLLQPAAAALLHNASTLAIGLKSMGNLL